MCSVVGWLPNIESDADVSIYLVIITLVYI